MTREELESRTRCWNVSRKRFLVVGIGIERWRQSARALAELLDRRPDLISWWAKRAAELRSQDNRFAKEYAKTDELLRKLFE